jgi:hypothetical protein
MTERSVSALDRRVLKSGRGNAESAAMRLVQAVAVGVAGLCLGGTFVAAVCVVFVLPVLLTALYLVRPDASPLARPRRSE